MHAHNYTPGEPNNHLANPPPPHGLTVSFANVASSDNSSSNSSVHVVVAHIRQDTPGRPPQPRRAHPSSLRWSSARMAAMRALAWASERGSVRPRGGRVSVSARKRSTRKSSSWGRGAESAVLLRDLYQPASRKRGGCFARTHLHRLARVRRSRGVGASAWQCGRQRYCVSHVTGVWQLDGCSKSVLRSIWREGEEPDGPLYNCLGKCGDMIML